MRHEQIPVGLATKLGTVAGAAAALAALVSAVLEGDHTPETLGALAAATIAVYKVMAGRYDQAIRQQRQAPLTFPGPMTPSAAASGSTSELTWSVGDIRPEEEDEPEPDEFDADGHLITFSPLSEDDVEEAYMAQDDELKRQGVEAPDHAAGNPDEGDS
jgi:hypothetical protein